MGLTRRNTVIGLGALVGGTGALAASGAFTTVEAQRDFSVDAEGDAAAMVAMEVVSSTLAGDETGDDIISLDAGDTGVNLRAITRFNPTLFVGNNSENDINVEIQNTDDSPASLEDGNFVVQFDRTVSSNGASLELSDFSMSDVTDSTDVNPGKGALYNLSIDFIDDGLDAGENSNPISDASEGNDAIDHALNDDSVIVIRADQA